MIAGSYEPIESLTGMSSLFFSLSLSFFLSSPLSFDNMIHVLDLTADFWNKKASCRDVIYAMLQVD
jgi:hypothetical protein